MRTRWGALRWALLPALCGFGECHGPVKPTMCLVRSAAFDPAAPVTDPCPTIDVREGEAVYLVHKLPDGVDLDGPLAVQVATPCLTQTIERPIPADGITVVAIRAPQGADCSLQVTTTIANSTLTKVTASAGPDACAAVVCDDPPDAGSGGNDSGGDGN